MKPCAVLRYGQRYRVPGRAFTDLLRREKGVEDARLDVLRNSSALSSISIHGIVQSLHVFIFNSLFLALHRIDGVVDQVGSRT